MTKTETGDNTPEADSKIHGILMCMTVTTVRVHNRHGCNPHACTHVWTIDAVLRVRTHVFVYACGGEAWRDNDKHKKRVMKWGREDEWEWMREALLYN